MSDSSIPPDLEIEIRQTFQALQPVCVKITENPCIATLKSLQSVLPSLSKRGFQHLQDYILFPLRILLKDGKKR